MFDAYIVWCLQRNPLLDIEANVWYIILLLKYIPNSFFSVPLINYFIVAPFLTHLTSFLYLLLFNNDSMYPSYSNGQVQLYIVLPFFPSFTQQHSIN